jgi:hypothetical protein
MAALTLIAALLGSLPSFHLVLSDGNSQLEGQTERIAENIVTKFREMGIEVTWSSDPSDPALPASNVVKVIVLPRSSEDWGLRPGVLAATRRDSESEAVVVVFYKDVERVLNVRQPRATRSIQGWRAPGRRVVRGVSRVVVHEIFHYFLPGRPHDAEGVFMDHVEGNLLARSSCEVSKETSDALITKLLAVRADPEIARTR